MDEQSDVATLSIETTSEVYGTITIELVGTVPSPEIAVTPMRLDFGATDKDAETMRSSSSCETKAQHRLT